MAIPEAAAGDPKAAERAQLQARLEYLLVRVAGVETQVGELGQLLKKIRQEADDAKARLAELERRDAEPVPANPAPAAAAPAVPAPAEPPRDVPAPVAEAAAPAPVPAPAEPAPPAPALPPPPEPAQIAQAAEDPRKLFGPSGEDGRPLHVLLDLLSRDALGATYRACERATSRFFAVRFMAGQAGEDQTAAIERAAERLIALPHPNILHVQGSGRRQNRLFVAMDLVDGRPLGQLKGLPPRRVGEIFRDAADAVHYAHEEGILHGDVSPDNILVALVEGRERVLVKDFGLGYLMESVLPASGRQAGLLIRSPAYLPPEQMKETLGALTIAADVYGLGASLYATLAGRPPFEGKDVRQVRHRVLFEEPQPLERFRPDVPEPLAAIARRAMAKEVSLRYGTAKELSEALTRYLEGRATVKRVREVPAEGRQS